MNSFKTSTGKRINKSVIDRRVREAKEMFLAKFLQDHGYYFCENCKRSDVAPFDCSHKISVDECQKSGRSELAYDINNLQLYCRTCHKEYDNNKIKP